MFYIGIDLGTSAVKLLLMDERGSIKNIVSEEYPLFFPHPGWSEQNPEDWMAAIKRGIPKLTGDVDRTQIAGIGAGGQMHGLVVLDNRDRVLRPAILWNDGRTQEETDYLNKEVGKEKLTALTGNIHCTDYSDASGMLLLDVRHKCWSREMMQICGISEEQLPQLFESWQVVGNLRKEAAKELELPETVKVVAGAGDNAAAAVGCGVVGEGRCNLSLGTSGTIFITSRNFRVDAGNALHAFAHADGGFHLMGCMLSAASCNKWWMEEILHTTEYGKEQAEIREDRLGTGHVYYLPYLMGERAPHNDPAARSCFLGMTMDTSRTDMTLAVLEGVAFGIRDSLEAAKKLGISVKSSMICGGGAKSPLWRRIFADVLNIELTVPETEQGPGYGGAILASVGCGEYRNIAEATGQMVHVTDTVRPDAETAERYEEKYQVYRSLYPALKGLFPKF